MGKKRATCRPGRPKKRRFHGNQFASSSQVGPELSDNESVSENFSEVEADSASCSSPSPYVSSSASKLGYTCDSEDDSSCNSADEDGLSLGSDIDYSDESENDDSACDEDCDLKLRTGYRIVDLEALQNLVSCSAVCALCKNGSLSLAEAKREGLASTLQLTCQACNESSSATLAKRCGRFWDVNRRATLGMRWIGRGRQALCKLCTALNMPQPVAKPGYNGHCKAVHRAAVEVASQSMSAAAEEVRGMNAEEEHPGNTAVSFDGTWMRRGFTSLFGVFTAIAWDTGKVVDYHVSSKFCQECSVWKSRRHAGIISLAQYEAFVDRHQCMVNTQQSSPGMEAEAAMVLWGRSEDKVQLRYTTYIGDGDSKGYSAVSQAQPYGGTGIVKEECVGHVQKRVGTNLRNLKKELRGKKLEDGLPIGGRGRLTDKMIDRLQAYYGMAVREHRGDLQGMCKAIWASIMHRVSTQEKPQHQFCPTGTDSWCGWQRVKAGSGEQYQHHDSVPQAVFQKIKPVYIRLTDKSLLQRCLCGATQNRNESLNGLIWQLCPKETFCGATTVETAAAMAVSLFNDGSVALRRILEEMQCPVGVFTAASARSLDDERVYHAERKASNKEKSARKRRRRIRKGVEEEVLEAEGLTYEAGAF